MEELLEKEVKNLESNYVRFTYEAIAEDFSSTRYKKWPLVDAFIRGQPQTSLLLDVGCGNGKYLDNASTFNIGCDISLNLLKICKSKGFEVVLCDMTRMPFRSEMFDSIICVAALHHIATARRRQKCLIDLVDLMNPERSQCLVQVWSFEQDKDEHNPYLKRNSTRISDTTESPKACSSDLTFSSNLKLTIHKNRTPFVEQDLLVPFQSKSRLQNEHDDKQADVEKLRYYHVFRGGELDEMFKRIESIKISQSYHDKGNWAVVAEKGGWSSAPVD